MTVSARSLANVRLKVVPAINVSRAGQATAETGTDNSAYMTSLRTKQSIDVNAELADFTPTGTGAVARPIRDKLRDVVSVKDFGAVLDGVTDDTAAFNAALLTGSNVFFPAGRAKITDRIIIKNFQRLYGAGPLESVFVVEADFNLAANSVIVFTGGNDKGMSLEDIGIEHYQPDTAVRANLIAYPPSIYMQSCPRVKLRRIRIINAKTGIDARGNSGGSIFEDIEISAYDYHTRWTNALDTVKLLNVHIWPFASGIGTPLTTNQRLIMQETACVGHEVDGVTDFQVIGGLVFGVGRPVWLKSGFGKFIGTNWDFFWGYSLVEGGNWTIDGAHASAAATSTSGWMKVTGGSLTMGGAIGDHAATTTTDPIIEVSGTGALKLSDSRINTGSANVKSVYVADTAFCTLAGVTFAKTNNAYTQPVVEFVGSSSGSVTDCGPTLNASNNVAVLIRNASTGIVTGLDRNSYRNYQLTQTLAAQAAAQGRTPSRENLLINGDFQVWQRGTSFAAIADNTYWADRWRTVASTSSSATIERVAFDPSQTDIPGCPKYYARITMGATASLGFAQRIDDVRTLAGQRATISYRARSSLAGASLAHLLRQNFGSGGSTQVSLTSNTVSLTTSWAQYQYTIDVSAIAPATTIGTNSFLGFEFFTGTLNSGDIIEITDLKIEAGPIATPFRRELYSEVAAKCKAYFERLVTSNAGQFFGSGLGMTTTTARVHLPYSPKRIAPTITYSGSLQLATSASSLGISSISYAAGETSARANVTVASGVVADQAVALQGGATTVYIDVSAEL